MRHFLVIVILGLFACNNQREVVFDVKQVIRKMPSEVETILGKPDSTYTLRILNREIFVQTYATNNLEIQYHNGGPATDIIIHGPHGLPFNQEALKAFNLDVEQPPSQFEDKILLRWYNVDEFAGISFYQVEKDDDGAIENFKIFFKVADKAMGER